MSTVLAAREPTARYLESVQPLLVQHFELLATAQGGVTRLRELILALAVQGKVVQQDSDDEPASELLRRIRSERAALVAGGLIKQGKPSAPISPEEEPCSLPRGWAWVRFGDLIHELCTGPFGSLIHKEDYVSGGVPLINPSHMIDGRIEHDPAVSVSAAMASQLSAYRLSAGDVLLARRGEMGRYALVTEREAGWLCGTGSFFLKLFKAYDRRFFGLTLEDPRLRRHLLGESVGATMTNLNQRILLDVVVAVAPLAEQARIVARVDELMRLCDALEAKGQLEAEQHARLLGTLLGTLTDSGTPEKLAANWQRVADHFDLLLDRPEAVDALEQTILQLAVRGLLVPQDSGEEPANLLLFEIHADRRRLLGSNVAKADKPSPPINEAEVRFALPPGWSWARLSELSNVIVDCPHSTAKFVDAGLLCLDTNSFKDGKLLPHKLRFVSQETFDERIARLKPVPGDLVFAREGSVGQSIIIPEGIECCLGQRVMLFRLSQRVSNEFVRLAITTEDFLDALLSLHKGIGAKHVNVADMRNAVVPVPPFREQERILARITELRRLCADLRERLAASQTTQSHLAEALVAEVA